MDKEVETTNKITRRLAICNMNWDRIRAVDLMIMLNSFLPNGGFIHSVTVIIYIIYISIYIGTLNKFSLYSSRKRY